MAGVKIRREREIHAFYLTPAKDESAEDWLSRQHLDRPGEHLVAPSLQSRISDVVADTAHLLLAGGAPRGWLYSALQDRLTTDVKAPGLGEHLGQTCDTVDDVVMATRAVVDQLPAST